MMTLNTMVSNKEMMRIVTSIRSSVTTTKMKKMICNKEKNTIVTAVSTRATMMTLVTMISSREMIQFRQLLALTTQLWQFREMTSYQTVKLQMSHICLIISRLRPINAFIHFVRQRKASRVRQWYALSIRLAHLTDIAFTSVTCLFFCNFYPTCLSSCCCSPTRWW